MDLSTKKETFEPFDDGTVVEIEKKPLSILNMATRMPLGLIDRIEEGEINQSDIEYFKWAVNEHTNVNFSDYVFKPVKLGFIINIIHSFVQDKDMVSWEEFKQETNDGGFVDKETLGVR